MTELAKKRPEFRNINALRDLPTYRLPAAGIVSILHRISAMLMFVLLPFVIWMFDTSVSSEVSFEAFTSVLSNPLAIADARSLEMKDLIAAERRYPDRVGETYQIAYNPEHEWYYFPMMLRDEAIVFKVYDSKKDGRARFTAHTAFVDPTTPADAPPRQSIEIRTLAFFDEDN